MIDQKSYQEANDVYQTAWRREVSVEAKLREAARRHLALPDSALQGGTHEDTVRFLRLRREHERSKEETRQALMRRDELFKALYVGPCA